MTDLERAQAYEAWMQKVNSCLERMCGMTSDDLPDFGYAIAYADGRTPRVVARQAIRQAGGF